jgi:hypothetical protein
LFLRIDPWKYDFAHGIPREIVDLYHQDRSTYHMYKLVTYPRVIHKNIQNDANMRSKIHPYEHGTHA